MYNYNSYIVGWHGIRPGQGGLSLTILPPVVHPQKIKTKRAKLKLESKNKLTIFITCLFPISVPYNCICRFFFIFAHMFLSFSVLIFVRVLFSPDFPSKFIVLAPVLVLAAVRQCGLIFLPSLFCFHSPDNPQAVVTCFI